MVLLPENLFPKLLYELMSLFYMHWFQLKVQWKKICDDYRRAVEKREEQTRSGTAKAKLATCRHFSLLGFLHSVVSSQNTDSNVEIKFFENKTAGQEAVKAPLICTLSEKSSNQRSNVFYRKKTSWRNY